MSHTPVLLQEVIKFLDPRPGSFVIDGTVDGGGHATAILKRIAPNGTLLGIEWDKRMLEVVRKRIAEIPNSKSQIPKVVLKRGNYADLPEILQEKKLPKADGLFLDLGFSSEQVESSGRGFSFLKDEPLLMTYDPSRKPVKDIIRGMDVKNLAKTIFELSGEKFAMRIAVAIKEREKNKPIETSGELAEVVKRAVPKNYERGRINPATRTFQALRIYANDELGNLKRVLANLPAILKTGGRVVVVSFHSLEDRIVKEGFREMAREGKLKILTKKPVVASKEEIEANPRARSAKLRAIKLI